jgi:hypothetical protein
MSITKANESQLSSFRGLTLCRVHASKDTRSHEKPDKLRFITLAEDAVAAGFQATKYSKRRTACGAVKGASSLSRLLAYASQHCRSIIRSPA